MTAESNFRAKAPAIIAQLLRDFPITTLDAAAIIGNAGHESLGLTALQEFKPVVAGSRGGWGWMQWTGPRRRAFEAYCKRTGKDPASDEANYAYLFLELKGIEGTEGKAIEKTMAAVGLDAKVEAFEKAFLRAGVKHYDSRKQWAKVAMDAWDGYSEQNKPLPPTQVPDTPPPARALPGWVAPAVIIILIGLALAGLFVVRF